MDSLRPQILNAAVHNGEVIFYADGVAVLVISRKHAMHVIARIARALAEGAL